MSVRFELDPFDTKCSALNIVIDVFEVTCPEDPEHATALADAVRSALSTHWPRYRSRLCKECSTEWPCKTVRGVCEALGVTP